MIRPVAFILTVVLVCTARSQCVTAYPYQEDFETVPAWTSGGTSSDWAWGTPAHPTINSAGGGAKSWCVGGLTGSFYNNSELSWLESPCFDLSSLSYPWISFKIFWETERQYDGMTFQYSVDGGATYANVGAEGDGNDCVTANWFNSANITNLTGVNPKHGWSGRIGTTSGSCLGGNGSGAWVTATHCLSDVSGETNVRFRFLFGAGFSCNNYDGIAIDDILIQEAPSDQVDFTYTCTGSSVQFTGEAGPCASVFAWDFGDPGSGTLNFSNVQSPVHVYSTQGDHTVSFTSSGVCIPASNAQITVTLLDVSVNTTDAACGGNTGSAVALVSGGSNPYSFDWEPGGQSTATATNLAAGDYSLTVSSVGACPTTVDLTIAQPANALSATVIGDDPTCNGGSDGSATANVSGGTPGYGYVWAPYGGTAATATGLSAGNFIVTITDANDCTLQRDVAIAEPTAVVVDPQADVNICAGSTATLLQGASGGTPDYTFVWSPSGPEVSPTNSAVYEVVAMDAVGCASAPVQVNVIVGASVTPVIAVSASEGCSPLCVDLTASPAGLANYAWSFSDGGSENVQDPTHCFEQPGTVDATLTVTDDNGCGGSVTVPDVVNVWPLPDAGFTATPTITTIATPVIHFMPNSGGVGTWLWDLGTNEGTSEEPSPTFTYEAVGCYTVVHQVTNAQGCVAEAAVEVCVEPEFTLFVPNAFTPNGDGINDTFGISTSVRTPPVFELAVYDRWGVQQWSTNDSHQSWNGDVAVGIYVWKLAIVDRLGKRHEQVGHVAVIR